METRGAIIDSFLNRLILSCYSLQASRRIVVSGLRGYERIRKLAVKTGGFINRVGKEERRLRKLLGKSNWFKKEAKKQQEEKMKGGKRRKTEQNETSPPSPPRVTSVLFVPKTRGSELQRRLQRSEERLSTLGTGRVRYCEQTGVTVRQLLQRNNPWAGLPCSHAGSTGPHGNQVGCLPCSGDNETKQSCTKIFSVYETTCLSCDEKFKEKESKGEEAGLRVKYCGTSKGGLIRRGNQNLKDLKLGLKDKLGDKTSHMFIHIREAHQGESPRPRWGMRMVKTYTSTFKRLLAELVHIKYLAKDLKIEPEMWWLSGLQQTMIICGQWGWGRGGGAQCPASRDSYIQRWGKRLDNQSEQFNSF